jgi:hypothetical protein
MTMATISSPRSLRIILRFITAIWVIDCFAARITLFHPGVCPVIPAFGGMPEFSD